MSEDDDRDLEVLGAEECWALLRLEAIGRLASISDSGFPEVVPVNLSIGDGTVEVRLHDGRTYTQVVHRPVSIQVDRFDWFHRTGWSVLVQGIAHDVPAGVDRGREDATNESWSPGRLPHRLHLHIERISGRRIELHQLPLSDEGYL